LLKLIGQRPCEVGKPVALPALQVTRADWTERWLVAHEPGAEIQAASGLVPVKDLAAPVLPPGLAQRLHAQAALWRIAGLSGSIQVVPRRPAATPDVQVLFGQRESAFGEGFGWIHQALYLVYAKDSYELTLDMPEGAVLSASVDGEAVAPRPLGGDRFALPLPPGEGLRRVRLRWVFPEGIEPLLAPRLLSPRLDAAPELTLYSSVTLPPGYSNTDTWGPEIRPGILAAGQEELARAATLASAGRLLIERFQVMPDDALRAEILLLQKRSADDLRQAAYHLDNTTPQEATLKQRLDQLRQSNAKALHDAGLDKVRAPADKAELSGVRTQGPWLLPARGQMLRWQAPANGSLPALRLQSDLEKARRWSWVDIGAILAGLTVLLILSSLPWAVNWLARLWPEQLLLVAVAGSLLWGFGPLAAALVVMGLAARLVLVARIQPIKPPAAEGSAKPQSGVS
jgi:hypothetical protein